LDFLNAATPESIPAACVSKPEASNDIIDIAFDMSKVSADRPQVVNLISRQRLLFRFIQNDRIMIHIRKVISVIINDKQLRANA
jgi:hypothetical protein